MKVKNLILGAGPSGIGAGIALGKDATVLEMASDIGGLSMSITIQGAVFDYGGHSFHTPHPEVRDLVFNNVEMFEQKRNATCFSNGEVIPYPFQKNYKLLSAKNVVEECEEGLANVSAKEKDFPNFEEFIKAKFGPGIAKHFMLPYNQKLWGRDLKRMTADWTAERVAAPEGIKEKFETDSGNRKPLQADTVVAYPAKGGFGEIFVQLGKKLHDIRFNNKVVKVEPKEKKVYTSDGSVYEYDNLISTLPITDFLKLISGVSEELVQSSNELDFLSMKLGLVVVNHPVDTPIQRFYSAEEHIAAHKIAINHNSSDYLRALPTHGIMLEISEGPEKKLIRQDMEQWIVDSLLAVGAIKSQSEVADVEVRNVKYSYPVPTHNRTEIMDKIKNWLLEYNIHTLGRFGEWAYINSDKAIFKGLIKGYELAGN